MARVPTKLARRGVIEKHRNRAENMLGRIRHTIKFPAEPHDLMAHLFPAGTPLSKEAITSNQQAHNLSVAINRSTTVHLTLDSAEHWSKVRKQSDRLQSVFHCTFPIAMPAPQVDVIRAFRVPREYPFYRDLAEWFSKASEIDLQIEMALKVIGEFVAVCPDYKHFRQAWPECAGYFVEFEPAPDMIELHNVRTLQTKLASLGKQYMAPKAVESLMATAAMLSEDDERSPDNWVGYYL